MAHPANPSILVATDLTESSDAAVASAAALAARTGAPLHLVHALDFADAPYARVEPAPATFQDRLAAADEAVEAQLARAAPEGAVVATRELILYSPWKAIAERAVRVRAELIVLGGHCPRGLADRLLGTTADRVLRRAPVPCLLVRMPLPLPLARVLVPVDFSANGAPALDAAFRWAARLGAPAAGGRAGPGAVELVALHVVSPAIRLPGGAVAEEAAGRELARLVERARLRAGRGAEAVSVRQEIRSGDAAEEILRRAADGAADLVVLGTHGQGAIERAIIGSVAQAVARAASCAVLLTPPSGGLPGTGSR